MAADNINYVITIYTDGGQVGISSRWNASSAEPVPTDPANLLSGEVFRKVQTRGPYEPPMAGNLLKWQLQKNLYLLQ